MGRTHRPSRRAPAAMSMDSIGARIPEEQGLRLAATSRPRKFTSPPRTHVGDLAADQLAIAMKQRQASQRCTGWEDPRQYSEERLAQLLGEAVAKGDPIEIANAAAMLHARSINHQVIAEHAAHGMLQALARITSHKRTDR